MTELLTKLFIKNKDNILDPRVRARYGLLSGITGIVCNLLLCIVKFAAGAVTRSVSVTADAFNNLSDAGSSIVTLIGFKLAGKPADSEHPYGHGRYEYVSALLISVVIIAMGFELLKTSVLKIIKPEPVLLTALSVTMLLISIAVKLWMCLFNKKLGNKLDAGAMLAASADSRNDCIATSAVLAALAFEYFTGIKIDGYAGVCVAAFVIKSGMDTARETLLPLLGRAPDPVFLKNIENKVLSHKEILGIHDLTVHDYGPGRMFVSLHAEIPCDMSLLDAHGIIDAAEEDISGLFGCEVCIHIDPVALNDKRTQQLKAEVTKIVSELDARFGIHDFRVTDGPLKTNIIFDIVIPFGYNMSDKEVREHLTEKISLVEGGDYSVVIHIDKAVL